MVRLHSLPTSTTRCSKIPSLGRKRREPSTNSVLMSRRSRPRLPRSVSLEIVIATASITLLELMFAILLCYRQALTTSLHARSQSMECGVVTPKRSTVYRSVMPPTIPSPTRRNSTTACSVTHLVWTCAWANSQTWSEPSTEAERAS